MRVLFVTPECAPHTKTGGLGDVSAALPAALCAAGADVRVLIPGYPSVMAAHPKAREAGAIVSLGQRCVLRESRLENGVGLYIVDSAGLYAREGGPYLNAAGHDWADNALRFGVLSNVAARLASAMSPLAWRPEVLHCNDWPSALAPAYLRYLPDAAASIVTVHNLAFQGNFPAVNIG
jgi:starch synthase